MYIDIELDIGEISRMSAPRPTESSLIEIIIIIKISQCDQRLMPNSHVIKLCNDTSHIPLGRFSNIVKRPL